jgi:hypothetical protein
MCKLIKKFGLSYFSFNFFFVLRIFVLINKVVK